jgi:gluconolactonase
MKGTVTIAIGLGFAGAAIAFAQAPAAGQRQGPGVQAPNDSRYAALIATCKTQPPPRPTPPAATPVNAVTTADLDKYASKEIPGVIATGQRWTILWQDTGNVADGIVGLNDGTVLIAQNDKSDVLKLDKGGKSSVAYADTNTGGAVSISPKGGVFLVSRGLNQAILQLAPQRKVLATKYNGDPLDCLGGTVNDITADSKGGAYFTMGGLFRVSPEGVITKYGENLTTNGIVLSADEKTLYVTNQRAIAAFDVQPDGSLKNQREFSKLEGSGDGLTIDSAGRIYATTQSAGIQVIDKTGKTLGVIPTPPNVISAAFGGPNKKTLYAVISYRTPAQGAQVLSIPMIAQGYKGRPK